MIYGPTFLRFYDDGGVVQIVNFLYGVQHIGALLTLAHFDVTDSFLPKTAIGHLSTKRPLFGEKGFFVGKRW